MARPTGPLAPRFWSKVIKGEGCWEWQASLGTHGYGQITVDGRPVHAHRVAWFLTHGEWPPKGLHCCHRCDNRRCVRPDHLFLGTHADNLGDMRQKGRSAKRLSESAVLAMYQMRHRSTAEIAKLFGVHETAVKDVLSGKTWRHLYVPPVIKGVTLQEAARRLGVTRSGLGVQAHRGVLKTFRDRSSIYVREEEIERYRREHLGRRSRRKPDGIGAHLASSSQQPPPSGRVVSAGPWRSSVASSSATLPSG